MSDRPPPTSKDLRLARERFRELLERQTPERDWQRFFAEHPYVLSRSLDLKLEPSDIVPLGRPGRSEPDFAFYPKARKAIPFCGLIELKRPDSAIITVQRSNIAILSRDAETAVQQLRYYSKPARLKELIPIQPHEALILGNNAYLFAIIGRSADLAEIGLDLYREMIESALPPNLRIVPFDSLLRQFEEGLLPRIFILVPERTPSPTSAAQRYNAGNTFQSEGRLDEAIREYELGLSEDDGRYSALLHYDLGRVYYSKGRLTDAVHELTLASNHLPQFDAEAEPTNQLAVGISKALAVVVLARAKSTERWGDERDGLQRAEHALMDAIRRCPEGSLAASSASLTTLLTQVRQMMRHSWFVTDKLGNILKFIAGED